MFVWLFARETMRRRVLVDDRDPGALAGGVGQRVVGEDGSAEVEQGDHEQQEDRDDEGELGQALAALAAAAVVPRRRCRLMGGPP